MIKYEEQGRIPCQWYDLLEIQDKPENTQKVLRAWGVPPEKTVLIGDSGGDGPHFEWGAGVGAFLIGSMTKWSLEAYCREKGIVIHRRFGPSYPQGESGDREKEMHVNFMELSSAIEAILGL